MTSIFTLDGTKLVPGDLARGGWSDRAQHGGPPCGILARAIEHVPTPAPMQVVRVTFDLFRAVPLAPLTIDTEFVRAGSRIQVVDATLRSDEQAVARATALKIRLTDVELPPHIDDLDALRPNHRPEDGHPVEWRHWGRSGHDLQRFHLDAVEISSIDDSFLRHGPGRSWFRLRVPLVAGEPLTPFVRLATLADMANGNSGVLDPAEWLWVNPDLTLHVHRPPQGEWIGMDSHPHPHATGVGVADTLVYDRTGPVARITQSQLIEPH